MIELHKLRDITVEDIKNLLLEEKEQPIQIFASKETCYPFSERDNVAYDYIRAAYVGQKLHEISEEFNYYNVLPTVHESILFEIKCSNLEKLAEVLLNMSYHFENENPEDEFPDESIWQYQDDVQNYIITPVCPDMIKTYNEFAMEEEDSD